jgi:glycerophosphoryl diester phosphodiesterase
MDKKAGSHEIRQLLDRFTQNWPQFLAIHLVVNVLVFVFLAPAATLLLRLAVTLSGDAALSDQDIFFFVISPVGLVSFVILFSVFSIIMFLEYAALITAAWRSEQGWPASVVQVMKFLIGQAPRLFRLAVLILVRVVLHSIPFVLVAALVYQLLLSDYDINYYLTVKPPQWNLAILLGGLTAIAWGIYLLRLFISWIFCLPLLLLKTVSPLQAISRSRDAAQGHQLAIGARLVAWLVLSAFAAAFSTAVVAVAGDLLIPVYVDSMAVLVLVLSLLSMFGYALTLTVTFLSTSLLCLLILKMFDNRELRGDDPLPDSNSNYSSLSWIPGRRVLALLTLSALLASIFFVHAHVANLQLETRTEIMAHRGASAAAPENTVAAVERAIESGAQWVEIDVQETADGEVVVIHDSDLKKIGGVPITVAGSTLGELQQVDIGSWFGPEFSDQRIPTLKQVLQLCKDEIGVNIELKYYGAQVQLEKRVAEIVDAAGMVDQVVVMSLSLPGIRQMRQVRPQWTLGLLSSVAVGDLAALDVDFLALNAKSTSRHLIRRIHENGKKVMVWTVNDVVGLSSMASRGVDVIITDDPALGISTIQQWEQLEPAQRLLMQMADIFEQPSLYQDQ